MINQTATGLNSRSKANPFDKNGFLPLITAPMYSIVDETNYQIFLDNKIQVCLPRNICFSNMRKFDGFQSFSLSDFIKYFIDQTGQDFLPKVCIDTANGNIPQLHEAITKAKEIHGDKLVIMAGNVASVEAFVELAKTGVDYIRVGIGGGGGCNTTSNTGVGQEDLEELIRKCNLIQNQLFDVYERGEDFDYHWFSRYSNTAWIQWESGISKILKKDCLQVSKVKIVADGISTYIKQCESKYGFNDNGYAAINKLLFAGADLVMVGKLFAQCLESAGEKRISSNEGLTWSNADQEQTLYYVNSKKWIAQIKYSGMSTQQEQAKYKLCPICKGLNVTSDSYPCYFCNKDEYKRVTGSSSYIKTDLIKPSEGSVQWIPVRWTLDEWLNGNDKQDQAPYLMGWINSIKSTMSYTGRETL